MPADLDEALVRAYWRTANHLGRGASLRLTLCASGRDGVQVVATARRTTATGSGAVDVAVGCGATFTEAIAALEQRLAGGEEAAG